MVQIHINRTQVLSKGEEGEIKFFIVNERKKDILNIHFLILIILLHSPPDPRLLLTLGTPLMVHI